MNTITINTYPVSELNEEALKLAHEKFKDAKDETFWADEIAQSLKDTIDAIDGVQLTNWELGAYCHSSIEISINDDIIDMEGPRAMAWIEHNFLSHLRIPWRGPKRWEVAKYGRYYRSGKVPPCPFTGVCFDDDFIDALLKNINEGNSLYDSIMWLKNTCQRLLEMEYDDQNTLEYFKDHASANEYAFLEDGRRYLQ